MNLLDENFPEDQRPLLRKWRVPHRQIGRELAKFGVKDTDIIPMLHRLRHVTFFTQDQDFFHWRLCHPAYCLVWLDVRADEAAAFVRRFLRHPHFRTQADRTGIVARVQSGGIQYWVESQQEGKAQDWRD